MARTGDIIVSVLSDSSGFVQGLQNDVQVAKRFANEVNAATASAGGNAAGRRIQELGRGLEDFAVGYQLGGLSMGLRGVSNNVSQLASTFSPMAGGIAGIGLAVAGLLPMLIGWGDESKRVADEQKRLAETLAGQDKVLADRRAALEAGFAGRDLRAQLADQQPDVLQQEQNRLRQQVAQIKQFERLYQQEIAQALGLQGLGPEVLNGKPGQFPLRDLARRMTVPDLAAGPFAKAPLDPAVVGRVEKLESELIGFRRRRETLEQSGLDPAILDQSRRNAAFADAAKAGRERADEFSKFNAEVTRAMAETAAGLADSLQSASERFYWQMAELEGMASMGAIGPDLKRRAEEQALRDFAKASGYLGQTPKLTGALRGSAAEFESRLSSTRQTSDQLLEKQLAEARKTADHTAEMKRLAVQIEKNTSAQPIVMEF